MTDVYSLAWLPEVLLRAGLKVAEVPGWRSRGRREMGEVRGVICHFTGGPLRGNMPSLDTLVEGRSDLAGPLAQLGLGRDGTYYVVAAGHCNHAGPGVWRDITTGNSSFVGIEAENTGVSTGLLADPWPDVQMDAYRRGVAAILAHVGATADMCCGHREWALPPGRKDDPNFDMDDFRKGVAAILSGTAPPPAPIPATEPTSGRETLRRGSRGDLVRQVQAVVAADVDGVFGPLTEAAVRGFQVGRGLVPDGIVGPKTWAAIDAGPKPAVAEASVRGILDLAAASSIAHYHWNNRGRAPLGYVQGMALCFARLHLRLAAAEPIAALIAAPVPAGAKDALAADSYGGDLAALPARGGSAAVETLRHVFVLLTGLGLRESSGRWCEGRDRSAANTTAETAEAGLFQTSWNARSAHPVLKQIFDRFRVGPLGDREIFARGVTAKPEDLENFGTGDGCEFQRLTKDCPAFAVEFAALALRHRRAHWGPISRHEAEVRVDCDRMFADVAAAVDADRALAVALAPAAG